MIRTIDIIVIEADRGVNDFSADEGWVSWSCTKL